MGFETWENYLLGDILQIKYGKDHKLILDGTIPIFGSGGIMRYGNKYLYNEPSILIPRKGTLSNLFYIDAPFWTVDTMFWTIIDNQIADSKFLYYQLLTADLSSLNVGSAVPSLTVEVLNKVEVSLPPLSTQRRIASLLTALDDKIELNRRMNETLEGIAQGVWGEWFGKYVGGGEELQEGTKCRFEEHLDVERGLSYNGAGLCGIDDGGIPMYNLNSVLEGGGFKYAGMKYYTGEYKERHLVNPGELIVTNTEQGHKYRLIGFPAVIPKMFGQGICSHHIYRVRTKPDSYLTTQFFYYLMMQPVIRDQIVGCANGTTVNMLKIDGLKVPEFYTPPEKLVQDFTIMAQNIWDKQEENKKESKTLEGLRDTLLPRLMRGELKV
jgi:type I restriction enzyme, S subunit